MREDDDERAALQRPHDLVVAAAQHLGRGGAVARPAVHDVRVGVRGVVRGGVQELTDGGEHALRVDGDGVVVEGGGRVEDRVVVDPPVGQGASDGEQAHGRLLPRTMVAGRGVAASMQACAQGRYTLARLSS